MLDIFWLMVRGGGYIVTDERWWWRCSGYWLVVVGLFWVECLVMGLFCVEVGGGRLILGVIIIDSSINM